MGNGIWQGHIAFGLVAFPVKFHAAARSQAVSYGTFRVIYTSGIYFTFANVLAGLGTQGRPMPLP